MSTVIVKRHQGVDQHGDPTGEPTSHDEPGARIAWAQAAEDNNRKSVLTTQPTVYFPRRTPDIRRNDTLITVTGRRLRVVDVQVWEHARREGIVAGTAVICKEVD